MWFGSRTIEVFQQSLSSKRTLDRLMIFGGPKAGNSLMIFVSVHARGSSSGQITVYPDQSSTAWHYTMRVMKD